MCFCHGRGGGGRGITSPPRHLGVAQDRPSLLSPHGSCGERAGPPARTPGGSGPRLREAGIRARPLPGGGRGGQAHGSSNGRAMLPLLRPSPHRSPGPCQQRAAVTVLRADGVAAGPLAEDSQGSLHRRHLPARRGAQRSEQAARSRGMAARNAGQPRLFGGGREAGQRPAPRAGGRGHGLPVQSRRAVRPASSRHWWARLNKAGTPREGQEDFQEVLEGGGVCCAGALSLRLRGARRGSGRGSGVPAAGVFPTPASGAGSVRAQRNPAGAGERAAGGAAAAGGGRYRTPASAACARFSGGRATTCSAEPVLLSVTAGGFCSGLSPVAFTGAGRGQETSSPPRHLLPGSSALFFRPRAGNVTRVSADRHPLTPFFQGKKLKEVPDTTVPPQGACPGRGGVRYSANGTRAASAPCACGQPRGSGAASSGHHQLRTGPTSGGSAGLSKMAAPRRC